ncbi:alpha/beta hydrolase-fold protein [Corynebacterium lactis]|uniref:alpha/beta hydrolase-fold protein n=1 Tax=Corynebacterium lactis TaxID=1231000 RepID=UPI0009EB1A17|nr:alpha/beta hydrolase-fold protein [Corynebacterium lactis]
MPRNNDATTVHHLSVPPHASSVVFVDPYRADIPLCPSESTVEVHVPEDVEVTYGFHLDDRAIPDPHNHDGAGPHSSILSADSVNRDLWPSRPSHAIAELPGRRLRLEQSIFHRRCTARFDDRAAEITAVFLDGDDWIHLHDLTTALDLAVHSGSLPEINRLFLPAAKNRREEYISEHCAHALATQIPQVIGNSEMIIVGQSLGGLAALRAGILSAEEQPSAVRGVLAQSPAVWWSADQPETDLTKGPAGGSVAAALREQRLCDPGQESTSHVSPQRPRIIVTAGAEEPLMHRHVDTVATELTRSGFHTSNLRTPGGHDPATWRHHIIPSLRELMG